jgi:hypothetical protein
MCEDQVKDRRVIGLLPLGLALIGMSILLPDLLHPAGRFSVDWLDGVRGLLAGIGIGIELMVLIRLSRQRRLGGS